MILLFPDHPRVRKLLDKLEGKYPRIVNWLEKLGIGETEPEDDPDPRPPHAGFPVGTNPILREYELGARSEADEAASPPSPPQPR